MRPQLYVVTLGAIVGVIAGRELEVGALATLGLVIVGMFGGLLLFRLFAKRSSA